METSDDRPEQVEHVGANVTATAAKPTLYTYGQASLARRRVIRFFTWTAGLLVNGLAWLLTWVFALRPRSNS